MHSHQELGLATLGLVLLLPPDLAYRADMADLFADLDPPHAPTPDAPLADRLRPRTLTQVVGQEPDRSRRRDRPHGRRRPPIVGYPLGSARHR